jgi:hypothetical protein
MGSVLAWAELELARARYPRTGNVALCAMLEAKYRLWARFPGAEWQDYLRGDKDNKMSRELISKLYFRHRFTGRPTKAGEPNARRHPRLKAEGDRLIEARLQRVQEQIWQKLVEVENRFTAPRLVILELVSPKYHRRLMKLQKEVWALIAEASRDRTDTKQTALLDLLEPAIEELGG